MYIEDLTDEIDSMIKKCEQIILWGCGKNAEAFIKYSKLFRGSNHICIDEGSYGNIYYGERIYSSSEVNINEYDLIIFTPFNGIGEFKESLRALGYTKTLICLGEISEIPTYRIMSRLNMRLEGDLLELISANKKYHNIHCGERVFIVCTGPSINTQNIEKLKNEHVIAVSGFCLHNSCKIIDPEYYCVPTFEESYTKELATERLTRIVRLTERAQFFYSTHEKNVVESIDEYNSRNVNYLSFKAIEDFEFWDVDLCNSIPFSQSVSIMALMIAIYMGFSEIYLVGVEHDSLFTGQYNHCYENQKSVDAFNNYDLKGDYLKANNFTSEIFSLSNLWKQYIYMREIASRMNINIYNATKGGILDVFERKEFEKLF